MNTQPTQQHPQPNPAPAWTPGPWTVQGHEIYGDTRYVGYAYNWSNPQCAPEYREINDKLRAEGEANARLMACAPEMAKALAQDVARINQLCDMVNHFAHKLGLGKKVTPEDWTDSAEAALRLAQDNGGAQ